LEKNTQLGVEKACELGTIFGAVGRGGEAGWASYLQCCMNTIENILYAEWNEAKTSKQSAMSWYHDYDCMLLDFYFLQDAYFIVGAGSRHTADPSYVDEMPKRGVNPENAMLIIPRLVKDAARKVTASLVDAKGNVAGVPANCNITSRSLRYGGLHEILLRTKNGNKASGIFRGGWWNYGEYYYY